MLFGRSLFAGALAAGLVSATGAAACSASVFGGAQVVFGAKGAGLGSASSPGEAVRVAVVSDALAECRSTTDGKAHVEFYLSGIAKAVAGCNGKAMGRFFSAGHAAPHVTLDGSVFRRVRMGPQPPARCSAEAEATSYSYTYVGGSPAYGRASAFGTTYTVGRGTAAARALAAANALRTVGVRQGCTGVAVAAAAAINNAGARIDCYALATLFGDAAVKRGGHREFECFGFADAASVLLPATTVVFQPQTAVSRALVAASPLQSRGAKAQGLGTATCFGVGVVGQTAVQGATAGNAALASGQALRAAFAKGTATGKGAAVGKAKWSASMRATAKAFAAITSEVRLLVVGSPASANAVIQAKADRVCVAGGLATASAVVQGYNQINDLILAPASRTVRVLSSDRELIAAPEPRLLAA